MLGLPHDLRNLLRGGPGLESGDVSFCNEFHCIEGPADHAISIMKRRKVRHSDYDLLIPLGRIAVFYVPAEKMDDPQFGLDGLTPTQMFDQFFLQKFGGLTHEESHIRGKWTGPDGQKVFTDSHQRYEVSFSGKKKAREFLRFLSEMCARLREDSIYLTIGTRSWLVKPAQLR